MRSSSACRSIPVISGIIRSHRIRSKRSPFFILSRASRTELAEATSCSLPSMRRRMLLIIGSSSMTRSLPRLRALAVTTGSAG